MNNTDSTILIFGHKGQVGWELRRTLAPLGNIISAGVDGADHELDITDQQALAELAHELRPALMVNATAYTAVDQAESEPELAFKVNAEAVGAIGHLGAALDCPVLHYSTDYVFSGDTQTPWDIEDEPAPQSIYGQSKLAGEKALIDSRADHLILRTAWVYGQRGKNFLLTMLRLFAEKEQVSVVADQFGAPTWSRLIAEATAQMLIQCKEPSGRFVFGRKSGLYHLTAQGQASWYDFAALILEHSGLDCQLKAITSADYPTPAPRPAYSVLDNSLAHDVFGVQLPPWEKGLALCLEEMQG